MGKQKNDRLPISVILFFLVGGFFLANWLFHAVQKPAEIVGLFDSGFFKRPTNTWSSYESEFRSHATETMTPEFLAALAQAETSGNTIARTYWTWNFHSNPFKIFRPASSATGLYQITDGTYQQMKRFCVHDGSVAEEGPWFDLSSCWFNWAYFRIYPSHAIEMTAAYLQHMVSRTIARLKIRSTTLRQRQDLATVIHLCGKERGALFAMRNFQSRSGERCGAHPLRLYLARVQSLNREFTVLSQNTPM